MQTTSIEAYRVHVLPTLGDRQKAVYAVLNGYNDLTNKELASLLKWEINTVTPRVNELVKLGLVEEKCKRICRKTGKKCIAWGVRNFISVERF